MLRNRLLFVLLAFMNLAYAQNIDKLLHNFDTPDSSLYLEQDISDNDIDISLKLKEELIYSYKAKYPHNNISSLKTTFYINYRHTFNDNFKFTINALASYDAIYHLRDRENYASSETKELEKEIELFDFYVQGKLFKNLDIKLGRQVIVWGQSDNIRISDVLNPLDNRRPGLNDIEQLRLPRFMMRLDYFVNQWRIVPIIIFENRFSKLAPEASVFNPRQIPSSHDKYSDISYALNIKRNFSKIDLNLYFSRIYNDEGYIVNSKQKHKKGNMFAMDASFIKDSWLIKTEVAYLKNLKYTSFHNKEFTRADTLAGFEYHGFKDTSISYDLALRKIHNYHSSLFTLLDIREKTYQHAFRISSDFEHSTIKVHYLLSKFGLKFNEGGYNKLWLDYSISDNKKISVGIIDYISGSKSFDLASNKDMFFFNISYSF